MSPAGGADHLPAPAAAGWRARGLAPHARRALVWAAPVALVWGAPAAAQTVWLDLPAAPLGEQVIALGRAARVSVVVPDPALWRRRVPALRGRYDAAGALAAIARVAGARAEPLGAAGWRLVPAAPRPARARVTPPPTPLPPPPPPADVIVTASKRDTPRDRFAGDTHRVDGATLALGGVGGTERLTQRLASVASTYLGAGRNKLFIRGIADSSFTGPTQATVGQYLGDLRLSYNAPDPDLRLADLAAVEVLEGPQGTLYGAGSLGGLIRLVPNAPDLAASYGSATLGGALTAHGAPGVDAQATLNLPLVGDRLGLRLVGTAASEGGYIDKPARGRDDVNRTRIHGGRAAALLRLGDGWSAELIAVGQRIRGADSQYADRAAPPLTRDAAVAEGFGADFAQGQLVLDGRLGAVRLRSTTGVTAHDLTERYDATPPGGAPRLFAQANRTRMTANETRLWQAAPDGSGWLAGFSYVANDTRLRRLFGAPDALAPTTGVTNRVDETTVYGEAGVRLLPGLLTSAGLRVTRSVLSGAGEDLALFARADARAASARRAQTIALPAAAAVIDLAPATNLFLRYQQGFRPGGIAIDGDFVRRFRNDRVATIEAGLRRGRPRRDRFDAAITVARTAWHDIQADFIDPSGLPTTANVGDGRLWTVEANAGAMPLPGLRLEAAATFNDSVIDEPAYDLVIALAAGGGGGDLALARAEVLARLRQIPNIARVTARLGAGYEGVVAGRALTLDGWLRYVGRSRLGVGPVLGQAQGDYVDTGLTARLRFGAVALSAGVTNLLDVRGNRFALGTPFVTGRDQVTPLRPRTLRIGVDAAF
ncbi:TonB-dependent receptor [Sphingomonas sp. BK235]|uniref:TonB-dependent receptor n=1 Tax=Sphingomonas sp. BK235 TaxID=2512131 RepID=UPI00104C1A8B|nr:TonB-dependent receptor [Sphingomonas sp. BK235]TCP31827.1 outer membrane receptor protein involved in Fe transport [Sphingomonas sp. BK235]